MEKESWSLPPILWGVTHQETYRVRPSWKGINIEHIYMKLNAPHLGGPRSWIDPILNQGWVWGVFNIRGSWIIRYRGPGPMHPSIILNLSKSDGKYDDDPWQSLEIRGAPCSDKRSDFYPCQPVAGRAIQSGCSPRISQDPRNNDHNEPIKPHKTRQTSSIYAAW